MKKMILPVLLLILSIAASFWAYPKLPDVLTTNARYNAVSLSKLTAVSIVPVLLLVLSALTLLIASLAARNRSFSRTERPLFAVMNAVYVGLLLVHALILAYGMGYGIDEQLIAPLVTGIVFIAVGNYLPLVNQNSSGEAARPDASPSDPWRRTRRRMALFFIGGGLLMLLSAFLPGAMLLPVFIALVVATSVAAACVSHVGRPKTHSTK
ncbi:SdpI family protein [Saccharibacillus alkalitolerans]|uniref:DUF1648 domain-containing protein n=1 Tax=Saccharibacillus alkalitolerans TaxID=2705290 RepID=A0ABX0F4Y9_9BACL|nr:hypothetical protein [Saccharibacillus alkalitolerans]NGZ75767.1 hypothetical protein [Saccharibacillus alkalitolerans]